MGTAPGGQPDQGMSLDVGLRWKVRNAVGNGVRPARCDHKAVATLPDAALFPDDRATAAGTRNGHGAAGRMTVTASLTSP